MDSHNSSKHYIKVTKNVPFNKRIQIGDYILVSKDEVTENGDIIAVKFNSQVILSRIKRVIRRYMLIDHSYMVIDMDDRRVLGKVIRVVVNS